MWPDWRRARGYVLTMEDLHETKEHVPPDGFGEMIEGLEIIEVRIVSSICAACENLRGLLKG